MDFLKDHLLVVLPPGAPLLSALAYFSARKIFLHTLTQRPVRGPPALPHLHGMSTGGGAPQDLFFQKTMERG